MDSLNVGGLRFRDRVTSISDEHIEQFLAYRGYLLREGTGNLCEPAPPGVPKWVPFSFGSYPYSRDLGNLYTHPWSDIKEQPASKIINANPFATSPYRKPHKDRPTWQIWDSAVGIPACANRAHKYPQRLNDTPNTRGCNTFWYQEAVPALRHTGPLGADKQLIRPTSRWTFDLRRMEIGWDLLEHAHALAHLWGETRLDNKPISPEIGVTSDLLHQAIAEIIVCMVFGLPLYVGVTPGWDGESPTQRADQLSDPTLHTKTSVITSTNYIQPALLLPWVGTNAPRVDSVLSGMLVSLFLDAPPLGYAQAGSNDRTGQFLVNKRDRWTCLPTVITIVGWAGVDFLMHQPLSTKFMRDRSPTAINYTTNAPDLLPPHTYWHYLALAARCPYIIDPLPEQGWWYLDDWFASPESRTLLSRTPPFACGDCMQINRSAPGAPKRPDGDFPDNIPKSKLPPAWKNWIASKQIIHRIADNSVAMYEGKRYGKRKSMKLRKLRKQAFNAIKNKRKLRHRERRAWERRRSGASLSADDHTLADNYEIRLKTELSKG